jgi:hypothetical protein
MDREGFWSRVVPSRDGCWIWTGAKNTQGYGHLLFEGRWALAHRVAYGERVAAIPAGSCICHHCDVPACCNPAHLFLGTRADNNRDRAEKGRNGVHRGMSNPNRTVTADQVAEMRRRYQGGGITQAALAAEYGIRQPQVSRIVRGESWDE